MRNLRNCEIKPEIPVENLEVRNTDKSDNHELLIQSGNLRQSWLETSSGEKDDRNFQDKPIIPAKTYLQQSVIELDTRNRNIRPKIPVESWLDDEKDNQNNNINVNKPGISNEISGNLKDYNDEACFQIKPAIPAKSWLQDPQDVKNELITQIKPKTQIKSSVKSIVMSKCCPVKEPDISMRSLVKNSDDMRNEQMSGTKQENVDKIRVENVQNGVDEQENPVIATERSLKSSIENSENRRSKRISIKLKVPVKNWIQSIEDLVNDNCNKINQRKSAEPNLPVKSCISNPQDGLNDIIYNNNNPEKTQGNLVKTRVESREDQSSKWKSEVKPAVPVKSWTDNHECGGNILSLEETRPLDGLLDDDDIG